MITKFVAVLHENGKPIRAFNSDNCIHDAYVWAHKNYNLDLEGIPLHKLPDDLKVTFHMMSEDEFKRLIK